jgi:hypothetical protein
MGGKSTIGNRIGWALAAAVAAAILVRAAVVASHTEGGWEILGDHLRAGLPRPLRGVNHDFDDYGVAKSQWLWKQADRLEADPKSTAADLMGAALSLNQFSNQPVLNLDLLSEFLWRDSSATSPNQVAYLPQSFNYASMQQRSRELAARATSLEPDEPQWWRLRVVLMNFQYGARTGSALVRPDFDSGFDLNLLDEAVKHDPDNALYEYLAGSYLWPRSADHILANRSGWESTEFDEPLTPEELEAARENFALQLDALAATGRPVGGAYPERFSPTFADPHRFDAAVQRYRQAFTKSFLATGDGGATAMVSFLDHCPGSIALKLQILEPSKLSILRTPIYDAAAWPIERAVQAHESLRNPSIQNRLLEYGQCKLIYQAEAAGEPIWGFRQNISQPWRRMVVRQRNRGPTDASALARNAELFDLLKPNERESMILSGTAAQSAVAQAERLQWESNKVWSCVAVAAAAVGWLLLALGIVGFVISRLVGLRFSPSYRPPTVGSSVALWFVILALSFALFGAIPAFEPELEKFPWSVAVMTAIVFVVLIGYLAWVLGRYVIQQGRLAANERSVKYHLARLALVVGGAMICLIPLMAAADEHFRAAIYDIARHFPNDLGVSKRNSSGYMPFITAASIVGAILQFALHSGLYITAGIGFLVLAFRNWRKVMRACAENPDETKQNSAASQLLAAIRTTSAATAIFAALMLLASIAAATQWIECLRTEYETQRSRVADPGWYEKAALSALELSKGH